MTRMAVCRDALRRSAHSHSSAATHIASGGRGSCGGACLSAAQHLCIDKQGAFVSVNGMPAFMNRLCRQLSASPRQLHRLAGSRGRCRGACPAAARPEQVAADDVMMSSTSRRPAVAEAVGPSVIPSQPCPGGDCALAGRLTMRKPPLMLSPSSYQTFRWTYGSSFASPFMLLPPAAAPPHQQLGRPSMKKPPLMFSPGS